MRRGSHFVVGVSVKALVVVTRERERDREAAARVIYDYHERHLRDRVRGAATGSWNAEAGVRERLRRLADEMRSVPFDPSLRPDYSNAETRFDVA